MSDAAMSARQDPADLRRALRAIAGKQGGFFTAAQAKGIGYSYASQRYHADRGEWTRVDHGIYRLSGWPLPEHPDLIRWTLWSKNRGVISHTSALAVLELGDFMPSTVHLTLPGPARTRRPGVTLHASFIAAEDILDGEGFRYTSAPRALAETAGLGVDRDAIVVAITDSIERGLADPADLRRRSEALGARAALTLERALAEVAQ